MQILYCGMQNYGGPGKIGNKLKTLSVELGYSFHWFHNSVHITPSFKEETCISIEDLMFIQFDIIFYNQWRNKKIYDEFLGKSKQILFAMYEQIPLYWKDFYYSDINMLLSSSYAINKFLKLDLPVINWAVKLNYNKKNIRHNIPIFFFPARDGGEYDRKGIFILDKALPMTKSKFTVNIVIKNDKLDFYKEKCKYLFQDSRVHVINNELSDNEYYNFFLNANALLCPSQTSGIELSLRDAIALEKEVLVTDILPMNELFNKNNAWMIEGEKIKEVDEKEIITVPIFRANYLCLFQVMDKFVEAYFLDKESRIKNISATFLYNKFSKKIKKILTL